MISSYTREQWDMTIEGAMASWCNPPNLWCQCGQGQPRLRSQLVDLPLRSCDWN